VGHLGGQLGVIIFVVGEKSKEQNKIHF
jgi:hypothetical protein